MKQSYYVLFMFLLFAACKKNDVTQAADNNGCVTQLKRLGFSIKSADSLTAYKLLVQNHLPTDDLEIEYLIDSVTVNGVTNNTQYVYAVQYLDGLPMLSSDFGYTFKGGVFKQVEGLRYSNLGLNIQPKQSLTQVRSLFLNEVGINGGPDVAVSLTNECLDAQFGYYDLNVRSTVPNHSTNFVMAWRITPKNKQYPQVFIRDDNGSLVVYYGDKIAH